MLKKLKYLFKIIFPFTSFLYLLQIEEYNSMRFLYWLSKFFFRRNFPIRDSLKYTFRVKILIITSITVYLLTNISITYIHVSLVFINVIFIPIYVLFSNVITTYIFDILTKHQYKKAANKIHNLRNNIYAKQKLKIVLITGSYGKTTIRQHIQQVLSYNYIVQTVDGNINTEKGIANWILENLRYGTEILILEADTYGQNELKTISEFINPDITIITNISDQHNVRFKDEHCKIVAYEQIFRYNPNSIKYIDNSTFKLLTQSYNYINILQNSNDINKNMIIAIAKYFKIDDDIIKYTLDNLKPIERRQNIDNLYGFECIDNSYNISFNTGISSIINAKNYAKKVGKKLIIVTGGIPELRSDEIEDKLKYFAKYIEDNADIVVLSKSDCYKTLSESIVKIEKYEVENYSKLLEVFEKFEKTKFVILFEPELNELYY